MKNLPIVIIVVTALLIGFCGGWFGSLRSSPSVVNDTIIVRDTFVDTIRYELPTPVDSMVIRYEVVKLPWKDSTYIKQPDTIIKTDSVYIEVPIYHKEYKDSTYQAWVSGYRVNLDSINVFQKTITEIHRIREPPKRWGLGVQVGAGYCGDKIIRPYIGVGISYNILTW